MVSLFKSRNIFRKATQPANKKERILIYLKARQQDIDVLVGIDAQKPNGHTCSITIPFIYRERIKGKKTGLLEFPVQRK